MINESESQTLLKLDFKPAGCFALYFEGQTDFFVGEMQQSHEGQRHRQVLGHGAGQAGRKEERR